MWRIVIYILAGGIALGIAAVIKHLGVTLFNDFFRDLNVDIRYWLCRKFWGLDFANGRFSFSFEERERKKKQALGKKDGKENQLNQYQLKRVQEKGLNWKGE